MTWTWLPAAPASETLMMPSLAGPLVSLLPVLLPLTVSLHRQHDLLLVLPSWASSIDSS